MAEFHQDIVYRKYRNNVSWSMANDDSALVKAYEDALKSFRESNGEEQVGEREDHKKEQWKSGREQKQTDEGRPERQWAVGSRCRAVWSEDGLLYPAALVSVEGDRGRVRFDGYGNEEDVDLSALLPEQWEQPWREKQQWVLGSRCRAVWSEDGLVYPAVLVWKKGERGRVQFEGYGNEEEVELSALLPPDEQEWRTKVAVEESVNSSSSSSDWRKMEKKKHYTRKEDATITLSSGHPAGGEVSSCSDPGKEQKERKNTSSGKEGKEGIFLPSSGPFLFLPPESPPPDSATGIQPLPLLPPPPPPCVWPPKGGDEDDGDGLDSDMAALSSMLLSWYLCGYHTGCYMAMQQAKADHERTDPEKHRVNYKYGRCTQ
ncbi:survival motor neuron protein-like isoform X3 [Megalops cyprinoides]|uniref:survival motor neuron protein-like isoform X3 n=1 Tax=Megalops cyprinoides TaxID=118141 RepID=UPI0018646E81|nr:survival motor neuron protein-like isoform X3 [Megalops cyprinoides]